MEFDSIEREYEQAEGEADLDLSGLLEAESIESDVTVEEELTEKVSILAGRNVTALDPAGVPTSQGQVPQIPPHNYSEQKGIAGALILPPLPPLGSASGKNPTPRPVRRTAKASAPRAGVEAVVVVPQATEAQARQTEMRRAETRAEEAREARTGQSARQLLVRRETVKPRQAQTPTSPAVVQAPPALPFGSESQRGTVVFVPGKGERLPLGSPNPNFESAPDATRDGEGSRQSSEGFDAKIVGEMRRTQPVAAREGSTLPAQPKTSVARRFLASIAGLLGLGREGDEREVTAKDGRPQNGKNRDIAAKPGATKPVLERVEAVAPDNSAASTEKKASNSRGVKDGSVSPLPPTPLPDSDAELGDGSGLKGEYYLGTNFEQYEFTRADKNLDLFWGTDTSPSPKLPIGGEWSVRWTGRIMPKFSERYTIFATADDGVRVWIDHKLILDGWGAHPVTEYAADVNFEAGKQYAIRVDYFQAVSAPSAIGIYWESRSQAKEFVPQDRLFYPLAGSKDDLAKDEKPQ
ncbi:MAG TPA: PA14 domain-containing protein [Abditibacteriaceae bacterium]